MPNLNNPQFDEEREPKGFQASRARLGRQAGAKRLGLSLWELPPGQAAYPYHYHLIDEELIVALTDGLRFRGPEGTRTLAAGEVVACVVGKAGAHQIWNEGPERGRFLAVSSGPSEGDDIVMYPDSNKLGAFAEGLYELYERDSAVDYWDGEEPPMAAGSSSTFEPS
ncbi:MAG: cupin domain-containing protein [Thermoleophilaceae bacterium]